MPRSVLMLSNDIRVKVSHRNNYALHSHVNFKDKWIGKRGKGSAGKRRESKEELGGWKLGEGWRGMEDRRTAGTVKGQDGWVE